MSIWHESIEWLAEQLGGATASRKTTADVVMLRELLRYAAIVILALLLLADIICGLRLYPHIGLTALLRDALQLVGL